MFSKFASLSSSSFIRLSLLTAGGVFTGWNSASVFSYIKNIVEDSSSSIILTRHYVVSSDDIQQIKNILQSNAEWTATHEGCLSQSIYINDAQSKQKSIPKLANTQQNITIDTKEIFQNQEINKNTNNTKYIQTIQLNDNAKESDKMHLNQNNKNLKQSEIVEDKKNFVIQTENSIAEINNIFSLYESNDKIMNQSKFIKEFQNANQYIKYFKNWLFYRVPTINFINTNTFYDINNNEISSRDPKRNINNDFNTSSENLQMNTIETENNDDRFNFIINPLEKNNDAVTKDFNQDKFDMKSNSDNVQNNLKNDLIPPENMKIYDQVSNSINNQNNKSDINAFDASIMKLDNKKNSNIESVPTAYELLYIEEWDRPSNVKKLLNSNEYKHLSYEMRKKGLDWKPNIFFLDQQMHNQPSFIKKIKHFCDL